MDDSAITSRKLDHIQINLENDVSSQVNTGLEKYRFVHQALPEIDLVDVVIEQHLFGKKIKVPIFISSMTGGTEEARKINQHLAEAAQVVGAAMGLGSMRAALEHPELVKTFQVRKVAPDIFLMSNLGAIQLNYGYTVDHCRRALEMVQADALILHLNPLQEALQPEGDTKFSGLLSKIESICKQIDVPVIVKEVGWGISATLARQLESAGVSAIDVAGAGGTSWSQVEHYRIEDPVMKRVAASFRDWGIPTADSIRMVKSQTQGLKIFASGGIRNGVEIAKCLALGASLGGMAGLFLRAAFKSSQAVLDLFNQTIQELRISMFAAGAQNIQALQSIEIIKD